MFIIVLIITISPFLLLGLFYLIGSRKFDYLDHESLYLSHEIYKKIQRDIRRSAKQKKHHSIR